MLHSYGVFWRPVLISMLLLLFGTGLSSAAEVDDSSLVVDAFNAFQAQDYRRALDTIETFQQTFPDSPLRDVALLLLARSALKIGEYDRAARAVSRFNTEFPSSPLWQGADPELKQLATRRHEVVKVSPETSATAAMRPGQATLTSPGEQPLERPLQGSVRIVSLLGGQQSIPVGQRGSIPFEIVNHGSTAVKVLLEPVIPAEMDPVLTIAGNNAGIPARLTLGPGAGSRGTLSLRMPDNRIDGHKSTVFLQVTSPTDFRLLQSLETHVTAEAPLLRAVTRVDKQKVTRGDLIRLQVTLLNAGTIPARDLTVRIILPPQLDFMGTSGERIEWEMVSGVPRAIIGSLPPGRLKEFSLSVKTREDSSTGQELRAMIEVSHGHLKQKEIFTSVPIIIQRR